MKIFFNNFSEEQFFFTFEIKRSKTCLSSTYSLNYLIEYKENRRRTLRLYIFLNSI